MSAIRSRMLNELTRKYPGDGSVRIRSDKYPDIDGTPLRGTLILEVPDTNATSANRAAFESAAKAKGIETDIVPSEVTGAATAWIRSRI